MVATKMETPPVIEPATIVRTDVTVEGDGSKSIMVVKQKKKKERKGEEGRNLQLRPGYMYREANWEIGRAAERAKVKVKEYKSKDRWAAWRKANAAKAAIQEKKNLGRKIKASK